MIPAHKMAEEVEALMIECLFTTAELTATAEGWPKGAVTTKGVIHSYGFHPGRLEAVRPRVKALLGELSPTFRRDLHGGAGASFLNLPFTASGEQWGEHHSAECLLCLGGALGMAGYCLPRPFWSSLPGGVPYVWIDLDGTREAVCEAADSDQRARETPGPQDRGSADPGLDHGGSEPVPLSPGGGVEGGGGHGEAAAGPREGGDGLTVEFMGRPLPSTDPAEMFASLVQESDGGLNPGAMTVLLTIQKVASGQIATGQLSPMPATAWLEGLRKLEIDGSGIWLLFKDIYGEKHEEVLALALLVFLDAMDPTVVKDGVEAVRGGKRILGKAPSAVKALEQEFPGVAARYIPFFRKGALDG